MALSLLVFLTPVLLPPLLPLPRPLMSPPRFQPNLGECALCLICLLFIDFSFDYFLHYYFVVLLSTQYQSHCVHRPELSEHCGILQNNAQFQIKNRKSPHFELDNGVVFGEESNENDFNSWLRTNGNNTPSHSLMTPLPLTPPEPTGGNLTEGDANALVNALAQHTIALTGSHQATQDLMRSGGALTVQPLKEWRTE